MTQFANKRSSCNVSYVNESAVRCPLISDGYWRWVQIGEMVSKRMLTRDINSACNCVLHCYIIITWVNASRNINKEFKRQSYGDNSLGDKIFDTFFLLRSVVALTHTTSLAKRNWITFDWNLSRSLSLSCRQGLLAGATYALIHASDVLILGKFLSASQTKSLTHRVIKFRRMFKDYNFFAFLESSVKERAGSEQCDDLRSLVNKVSLNKFAKI